MARLTDEWLAQVSAESCRPGFALADSLTRMACEEALARGSDLAAARADGGLGTQLAETRATLARALERGLAEENAKELAIVEAARLRGLLRRVLLSSALPWGGQAESYTVYDVIRPDLRAECKPLPYDNLIEPEGGKP